MRLKRKYSSSDDEDNVVLSTLVKKGEKKYRRETALKHNINKNNNLLQYEIIDCEFCDKKFYNRLEILVHNASHIVIPLFKEELAKLHSNTQDRDKKDLVLTENGCQNECEGQIITCDVGSETKNVLDNFLVECKVNVDQLPQEACTIDVDVETIQRTDIADSTTTVTDVYDNTHPFDEIMGRLTSDCQVVLGEPVIFSDSDDDFTNNDDNFTNNDEICANDNLIMDNNDDFRTKAVDYSLLTAPIYVKCEYCHMWFVNRFEKIKHETCHIRVRRSAANYCVACELKKTPRYASLPLCTDCAKIHDLKNIYSYTFILCKFCPNRFASIHLMECHLSVHGLWCSKTPRLKLFNASSLFERLIVVCKVCFMFDMSRFRKYKKIKHEYKHVAYVNGLEMRCEICKSIFTDLYLVLNKAINMRHESKSNLIDRLNFENTENGERKPNACKSEKKLTNTLRLKHIQDRLKRMKIIGKY